MNTLLVTIIIGGLAYLMWSLRRFVKSTRRFLEINTSEGTITSRLLPNLSFGLLFFLLIYQTLLIDARDYLGVPKGLGALGPVIDLTRTGNPIQQVLAEDEAGKPEMMAPRPMRTQRIE